MNHSVLLRKLESHGIRGKARDWLETFLIKRLQCTEISKIVKVGNTLVKKKFRSPFKPNYTGVPQGSILGPLLFLLYINDLPQTTPHKCVLYADDTTLLINCDDKTAWESTINTALADVVNWMSGCNLQVNIEKTKIMQFHSYNTKTLPIHIMHGNKQVEEVSHFKFLGITIDEHLNWKQHIHDVCGKLNRFVFALKRLRQTVSKDAALTAYHGYVASVLNYGLMIWGNSVDFEKAFKLQKKCVRSVANAWFLDSCKPLFKQLKILPLPCMYIRDLCLFVKQHPELFNNYSDIFPRQKRTKYLSLLYQPPCHTSIYKNNVFNMCILVYNKLPDSIKKLNINMFKPKLRDWLSENCFYSVKEYLNVNFE